jgi:adenylyltransferase/sulfurtransferase
LQRGDRLQLVDVREPHEWEISNLGHLGAVLLPKNEVLARVDELDTAVETIIYCRSGARSADVVRTLQGYGFAKLWNLEGGINRWAEEVDTTLPKY